MLQYLYSSIYTAAIDLLCHAWMYVSDNLLPTLFVAGVMVFSASTHMSVCGNSTDMPLLLG